MNLLSDKVNFYDDSFRGEIEPTALGFLRQLEGLCVFDLKGKDQSRTRVLTTLIHGNEPSGFIACHLWLRSNSIPATNVRILICNPEAARTKPIFSNRYLANCQDLNRFFSASESDDSPVATRARQIKKAVLEVSPESVLDLHNTSGASPAFAVAVSDDNKTLDLVSLFTSKLILTGLSVGAIMEQTFNAPIATIECGGANEIYSHQVATDGLHEYFSREDIFSCYCASSRIVELEQSVKDTGNLAAKTERRRQISATLQRELNKISGKVEVYYHPIRVELSGEASVGFSHHRLPTTDITLRADIEQLNRQKTHAGEFIGWYEPGQALPLRAIDEQGVDQIERLLECKNGCLFARQDMQFFMVTTTLEIATNDCLFYVTAS